jgi:hypothetical protein
LTRLGDTHEQEGSEEDRKKNGGKKGRIGRDDAKPRGHKGHCARPPRHFKLEAAAKVLKIKPFYQGAGALPFSCFQATQMHMDPPKKVNGVTYNSVNDFRLAEGCLQHAKLHFY